MLPRSILKFAIIKENEWDILGIIIAFSRHTIVRMMYFDLLL